MSLDRAPHLNRLCVVVNVDDPHPLVVQVLRLLREDHVGPAVAQLLLVYVEDPSLNLVLEQKFSYFSVNFVCLDILQFRREVVDHLSRKALEIGGISVA